MSVCMSDISGISLKEDICQPEDFGGMAEVSWPALVSFFHRIFGISFMNNFILAIIINSFTCILLYLTFKNIFSKFASGFLVLLLFSLPINRLFLFSTSKEPLYNFFLSFCFLILVYFNRFKSREDFFMLGVLFAFFPEERIQFIFLFPIMIFLILLRKDKPIKDKLVRMFFFLIPLIITFPYKLRIMNLNLVAWFDPDNPEFLSQKISYDYISSLFSYVFNDLGFILILSIIFTFIILLFYRKKTTFLSFQYLFYFTILYNLSMFFLYIYSTGILPSGYHYFTNLTFSFWLQFLLSIYFLLDNIKLRRLFTLVVLIFAVYNLYPLVSLHNPQIKPIISETFFKRGGDDIIDLSLRFKTYSDILRLYADKDYNVCYLRESWHHHNQEYIYIKDFQEYSIKGMYDHTYINNKTFLSCNVSGCSNLLFLGETEDVNRIIKLLNCYEVTKDEKCVQLLYNLKLTGLDNKVYDVIFQGLKPIFDCKYDIEINTDQDNKIDFVSFINR